MAAVDFPNSPTTNQVFTSGSLQYQWDGAKWASGQLVGYAPLVNVAGGVNNYSPIASPTFTGTPSGPTATVGTTTTQLATTQFVGNAITNASTVYAPLTNPAGGAHNYAPLANGSFTGTMSLNGVAVTTGGPYAAQTNPAGGANNYASLASPVFTGTPDAPTPVPTDNSTAIATTAYVTAAITAAAGVTSFNGRSGAVTLAIGDILSAGGAPLASPAFTGTPSMPTGTTGITQTAGNSSTALATTAFVTSAISGFSAGAVINATPPASPSVGELWWDSTGAQLYVYYNDGTSSQWVPAINQGTGTTWAPIASPIFTGTVTLPDTSAWSNAGLTINESSTSHSTVYFGSGGTVPPTTSHSSMTSSATALNLANGSHVAGSAWVADATSACIVGINSSGNAVTIYADTGLTVGNSYTVNPRLSIQNSQVVSYMPILSTVTGTQAIAIGPNLPNAYASLYAQSGAANFSCGTYYNGSAWIPTGTTASILGHGGGSMAFYNNTGLTAGTAFTPTSTLLVTPTQATFNVGLYPNGGINTNGAGITCGTFQATGNAVIAAGAGGITSVQSMYFGGGSGSGWYVYVDGSSNHMINWYTSPWSEYYRFSDGDHIWTSPTYPFNGYLQGNGAWYGYAFTVISDLNTKTFVEPDQRGLDVIRQLQPKSFIRKPDDNPAHRLPSATPELDRTLPQPPLRPFTRESGFVAQDIEAVLPDSVSKVDDTLAFNPMGIIAALVNAVKELDRKVNP